MCSNGIQTYVKSKQLLFTTRTFLEYRQRTSLLSPIVIGIHRFQLHYPFPFKAGEYFPPLSFSLSPFTLHLSTNSYALMINLTTQFPRTLCEYLTLEHRKIVPFYLVCFLLFFFFFFFSFSNWKNTVKLRADGDGRAGGKRLTSIVHRRRSVLGDAAIG